MNLDDDERLLKKGEYRRAYALEVIHSEGDDEGALEKPYSNKQLTHYELGANIYEMGKAMDNYQKKIYWFTLSDTGCRLFEWDDINQVQSVVLEDTRPEADRVFKLKKENLITGVVKVISQDVSNDLFMWTDDNSEICCINIERAKTWGTNNFNKEDIYLIKKPPRFAPRVTPTYTADGSNNIEERFLSFAYRYRYRDGEYSAISDYTNYNFYPGPFELDYFNLDNQGMVNSFNAMKIDFNTGDKQVTEIQVLVKQPNSNNLYIVETFSKAKNGWGDFLTRSHVFSNSKIYKVLPEKELYRSYDNVPRKAKALALIENYPIFGNYLEGYNIVNNKNKPINIDYTVALQNNLIEDGDDYTVDLTNNTKLKITNQEAYALTAGKKLVLTIEIDVDGVSAYTNEFFFILNDDYPTLNDVFNSVDFKTLLEVINQHFRANYTFTVPDGWALTDDTEITYALEGGNPTFTVKDIDFQDTNDGDSPQTVTVNFGASSIIAITDTINATSCKTNRNYEVGIIYMDEFGRRSTVLTSASNTLYIPQRYSVFQNRLVASINHEPPYWADRYKLVVKTNPLTYQTLFITKFYTEDLYTWCKLEGNNKDKINEGDILIIKKAGAQVAVEPTKVKVLELKEQEENFISGNTDEDENEILEEKGWYMKIRPPQEFSMDRNDFDIDVREFGDRGAGNDHKPVGYLDLFTEDNGEGLEEKPLPVGTNIKLFINSSRNYKSGWKNITFDEEFYTQRAYDSIGDWFNDILLVDGRKLEGIHDNSDEVSDYRPQMELVRGNLITTNGAYAFQEDPSGKLYLKIQGLLEGSASKKGYVRAKIVVRTGSGFYAFETENKLADQETFFETQDCYEVIDGNHSGNIQNQDFETGTPGIIELDFFNCFTQGDGIESYRVKDDLNTNYLNIDLRPSATSVEEYREVRRFADLTYGQPYIESTNINGLNEFNLSTANYKELDKQNGSIQMLIARENDILVMQEEKIGRVSFGKNLLETASGERILTKGDEILGIYQPYAGVLGVGNNPESVDMDGDRVYYVSARNGTPVRLSNDGTTEINYGLTSHFRNLFIKNPTSRKIGGWDPYRKQYVLMVEDDPEKLFETYCGNIIQKMINESFTYIVNINNLLGDFILNYEVLNGAVTISANYDGENYDAENVNASGNITIPRNNLDVSKVYVTVTPVDGAATFK
ncbi:MAG: hypothetical protein CL868_06465 [Cytophagaceae bacterium]|nr:hypothetical protein [Cytophagaceae bacterium]